MKSIKTSILLLCIMIMSTTLQVFAVQPGYLPKDGWNPSAKRCTFSSPDKILDGNPNEGGNGVFKIEDARVGDWILIDMKDPKAICNVVLETRQYSHMHKFKMYISDVPFSTEESSINALLSGDSHVVKYAGSDKDVVSGRDEIISLSFKPTVAQYILFVVYENTNWINLGELYVYDTASMVQISAPMYTQNSQEITENTFISGEVNANVNINFSSSSFINKAKLNFILKDNNDNHIKAFGTSGIIDTTANNNELQAMLNVPEDANSQQYTLKTFLWDENNKPLLNILPTQTLSVLDAQKDVNSNYIIISGEIPTHRKTECITIEVTDKTNNSLSYMGEITEFDENKKFSVKFLPMNIPTSGGVFNVKISGTVETQEKEVVYKQPTDILNDIKACENVQQLTDYLNTNKKIVGLDLDKYADVSSKIVEELFNTKQNATSEHLKKWYGVTIVNVYINENKLTNTILEGFLEELEIDSQKYNLLSSDNKLYLVNMLLKNDAQFAKTAAELTYLRQGTNEDVTRVLTDNGVSLNKFNQLTTFDKDELIHFIKNENFTSFSQVQTFIDNKADAYLESDSTSDTGSGSGGGGGGGGGGSYTPPPVIEKPKVDKPLVENESKTSTSEGDTIYDLLKNSALFDDLDNVAWAKEAVLYLAQEKIVTGNGEGKFLPDNYVTRGEFIKMLALAVKIDSWATSSSFSDITPQHWAFPYIATFEEMQILQGSDNMIFPDEKITRQDLMVITYRTLKSLGMTQESGEVKFSDSEDIALYAKDAVNTLYGMKIVSGVGDMNIAPLENTTRAQAAQIIFKTVELIGGAK